ncbi:MAG: YdcH family protein [Pseudomonadota bacterium]
MVGDEGLIPLPNVEVRARLVELRQQHQDLDAAVAALEDQPLPDQLQIARLKKQKLVLRDQIAKLENQLTPDIIA